jgi:hypothetical protein
MTYRVEYNGSDVEVTTLDSAIEGAKQAITADIGPVSGYTVEHDETINDWFVQGVADGSPVGATAVVTGPEPVMTPPPPAPHAPAEGALYGTPAGYRPRHPAGPDGDGWLRSTSFTGVTPVEAFGKATAWLAGRPDAIAVSDVGWHAAPDAGHFELRLHYRGPAD